jgi:hypothetical protein
MNPFIQDIQCDFFDGVVLTLGSLCQEEISTVHRPGENLCGGMAAPVRKVGMFNTRRTRGLLLVGNVTQLFHNK